jgi:CRP-like cAMP-binding protein
MIRLMLDRAATGPYGILDQGGRMGADYLKLIKEAKAFEGAAEPDLEALVALGQPLAVSPGEAIVKAGSQADAFFLIGTGRVDVVAGPEDKREVLASLGPGQLFGEMAMIFQDAPRIADVVAQDPTEVLRIDYATFRGLEGARPGLYRTIMDNLSQLADARSWTNPVDLIFSHYISAFSDK